MVWIYEYPLNSQNKNKAGEIIKENRQEVFQVKKNRSCQILRCLMYRKVAL